MIASTVLADLARHWDEGWNGADVDVIMGCFAPDVVFTSPFVPRLTGDPRGAVEGHGPLREYVVAALERAGDVRYTLHDVLGGTDTAVLVYTCHLPDGTDKPGADLMRVDADGRVVEWRCHYATDPTTWRP